MLTERMGPSADGGPGPAAPRFETMIVATPDLAGRLVGKRLTGRHFAASGGIRLCDVLFGWGLGHELLRGFESVGWEHGYGDLVAEPDPASIRPLAWWPSTGLALADAVSPAGSEVAVAPRTILRRQLEHAVELGFEPIMSSELEFTVFAETPASLHAKGYSGLRLHREHSHPQLIETLGLDEELLLELRCALEDSGIHVESLKAEYSASQFEITLDPVASMEAADRHAVYKLGVHEICRRHGLSATFMAKWHEDRGGQSCHLHVSLADAERRNLFAAGDDELLLRFIGGLERYAADVFMLWAPYPNSYKRLRSGSFAPASLAWGGDNRTVAFRVCGNGATRHLENRVPGADVNPWLAYAALLAAGLAGIREGLAPDPGVGHANAYARTEPRSLPESLEHAVRLFRSSEFNARAFGPDVVQHLANFAEKEIEASRVAVTDFDRRRLFEI